MANWGSDIWYTELDQSRISHLNLLDGTPEKAVDTGRAVPWNMSTNGKQVVWSELTAHGTNHADWSVQSLDSASGQTTTIDSGSSQRSHNTWDSPVALGMDGSTVAYAIGAATAEKPYASTVVVRDLNTGSVIRQFDTDLLVYDIGVSGNDVAYSEGSVTSGHYQLLTGSRLMLMRADDVAPTKLADDTFQVSFDEILASFWVQGPPDAEIGPATGEDVIAVELPDLTPTELSRSSADPSVDSAFVPTAAEGYAAWTEASNRDQHLIVWDSRTGSSQEVATARVTFYPSIGDGWLVWSAYADVRPGYESNGMFGLDLAFVGRWLNRAGAAIPRGKNQNNLEAQHRPPPTPLRVPDFKKKKKPPKKLFFGAADCQGKAESKHARSALPLLGGFLRGVPVLPSGGGEDWASTKRK